jgi:carbon starvation protein
VGEQTMIGRTGGAPTFAVGMAHMFAGVLGRDRLPLWYHFAIMFEALFILTTIDAGTRIARFILQEALGKVYKPFGRADWIPGNLAASFLVVFAWGYFIYTGSVTTIWPMFGTANQLLATLALAVGTSFIINRGKARYAWVTIVPMAFVGVTTLIAGWMNIANIYWPQIFIPATRVQGSISLSLTTVIMASVVIIVADAAPRWVRAAIGKTRITVDAIDTAFVK